MAAIGGVGQDHILAEGGCQDSGTIVERYRATRVYRPYDLVGLERGLCRLSAGHVSVCRSEVCGSGRGVEVCGFLELFSLSISYEDS